MDPRTFTGDELSSDPQDAADPRPSSWALNRNAGSVLQSLGADEGPSESSGPPDTNALLQQALIQAAVTRMGAELNPVERDREHALFSRTLMNEVGPLGPALTPLYSAAKAYAQSGLPGAGGLNAISRGLNLPLAGPRVSAPSLGEVNAGVSGLLHPAPVGVNAPVSVPTVPTQDQRWYTLLKFLGVIK